MLGERFYDETGGQFTANNLRPRQALRSGQLSQREEHQLRIPTTSSTRRWPASATATTAAVRSGRSSMLTRSRAKTGCRSRRSSIMSPRLLLQWPNSLDRTRGKDPDEIPARADVAGQTRRARSRATIRSSMRGEDADFGKPAPRYKIATPPFYAAWSTPVLHDTRAGLRINAGCQVIDMQGAVIPGLYCGGESAGGFSQHGLGALRGARPDCRPQCSGRSLVARIEPRAAHDQCEAGSILSSFPAVSCSLRFKPASVTGMADPTSARNCG